MFAKDGPKERRPEENPADAIVQRMVEMNKWRSAALQGYTATRRYVGENKRLGKRAEVEVAERYAFPGTKALVITSEQGNGVIRKRVIAKLIEAELDSNRAENRDQGRVDPDNYTFELLGEEPAEGRDCYLLGAHPREKKKYLMEGRIWVDKEDFAIVRMEGRPAKKPSFWVREATFVRRYTKVGAFWMTAQLASASKIWIVGASTLEITYDGYRIESPQQARLDADPAPSAAGEAALGRAAFAAGAP